MDLTQVYADITKSEREENGDLMVTGIAASSTLDIDQQIADPEWLKSAMPRWMEFGNVREQHSKIAAGVGMELSQEGDNWQLKAAVIDPVTALKVEKKVLKGMSIGIKGPRIDKSAAALKQAPGGIIVGGEIVEISLVDRPANADCRIDIAKAAGGDWEPVDAPEEITSDLHADVDEFNRKMDKAAADGKVNCPTCDGKGTIMGGNRDCPDCDGTGKVTQAKADDLSKAADGVKAKAAAIVESATSGDLLKATDDESSDIATAGDALKLLATLIQSEAQGLADGNPSEAYDIETLLDAVRALRYFVLSEQAEQSAEQGDDSMAILSFGVDPDIIKAASADDATDEAKDALTEAIQKSLGIDADALGEKIAAVLPDAVKGLFEERSNALEERLARVEGSAAPGGPVTTRTNAETAKSSEADHMRAEAAHYRQIADQVDFETAKSYREKAAECDAAASKLAAAN